MISSVCSDIIVFSCDTVSFSARSWIYHIFKNGENYNAELYRKSDQSPIDREITVEQAILIGKKQGLKSSQQLHNLNFSIFDFKTVTQRRLVCHMIKGMDTLYFSFSIFTSTKYSYLLLIFEISHYTEYSSTKSLIFQFAFQSTHKPINIHQMRKKDFRNV